MKKLALLVGLLAVFALSACNFDSASLGLPEFELPGFIEDIIGNDTTNDENNDDNQTEQEHVHEYTWTVKANPTCDVDGEEVGTCECGETTSRAIAALGHEIVVDAAVAATCTETGLTEGKHCAKCDFVEVAQEIVPVTHGEAVLDAAVAPTCTETGLTEGSHCSLCNAVFVAQEEVAALGHTYSSVVTAPTCTVEGYTTYTCSVCNDTYTSDVTEVLPHVDENLDITCDYEGCTKRILPAADSKISLFTARHMIIVSLSNSYYMEGVITEVKDANNGIFILTDEAGDSVIVRLPKDADGNSYSSWKTVKVVVGDTVSVYGKPTRNTDQTTLEIYDTKVEGAVLTILKHEHKFSDATCTLPATCACLAVSGTELGHIDENSDNLCDRCDWNLKLKISNIAVSTNVEVTNGVLDEGKTSWTWSDDAFNVIIAKGTSTFTLYTTSKDYMQLKKLNTLTVSAKGNAKINSITISATNATYLGHLKNAIGTAYEYTADEATFSITIVWDSTEDFVLVNNGTSTVYVKHVQITYEEVHTHEYTCTTTATCTTSGVNTYVCSCGDTYTEEVAALGHTSSEVVVEKEVAATCTDAGSYDNVTYCTVCNEELTRETVTVAALGHSHNTLEYDEEGHWYTCVCGDATEKEAHKGGNATLTDKAVCEVCGVAYGEVSSSVVTIYFQNNWLWSDVRFYAWSDNGNAGDWPGVKMPLVGTNDGKELYAIELDITQYPNYIINGVKNDGSGNRDQTPDIKAMDLYEFYATEYLYMAWDNGNKVGHWYMDPAVTHFHNYEISKNNDTQHWMECSCGLASTKVNHAYGEFAQVSPATCTEAEVLEAVCSCGHKTTKAGVAALGHTEVVEQAVAATCTEAGKTEGKHCSVCETILVAQTEIPALGHTEVVDAAVEVTCTEAGKTEGSHCSVCNEVFVAQTTIPALGHDMPSTHYEEKDGGIVKVGTCSRCGVVETVVDTTKVISVDNYEDLVTILSAGYHASLTKSVDLPTAIVISKDAQLTLASGVVITLTNDTVGDGAFCVTNGATLTIDGNGTINGVGNNAYNMALWAKGGHIVINGGIYTNVGASSEFDGEHFDLIYVSEGGSVTINGGTFKAETPAWTLNIKDNDTVGKFVVNGGTFYGYNPEASKTEPADCNNNFLGADCLSYESATNVYTVVRITSITEALEIGGSKASNAYTTEKYVLIGTVTGVYNTTYGNFYLKDDSGNKICVYGLYSANGSTRYDAMSYKPVEGDVIVVTGVLGKYDTTIQMKNGWLLVCEPHTHEYSEATCSVAATCSICKVTTGTTLPHNDEDTDHACDECEAMVGKHEDTDGDSVCEYCGEEVASEPVIGTLAEFTFGNNGSASHVDGNDYGTSKSYSVSGYTLSLTSMSKVFGPAYDAKGNSCIKLGTSSKTGSLTFKVPENVTEVVIYVAGYKAATSTNIKINGTQYTVKTASNNGAYTAITIDTTTTKTITLTTVTYRCMINTIVFNGYAA